MQAEACPPPAWTEGPGGGLGCAPTASEPPHKGEDSQGELWMGMAMSSCFGEASRRRWGFPKVEAL